MNQIMIDSSMQSTLANVTHPVELCDATGNVIGRFIPRLDPSEYNLEPQISDAEMDRRLSSDGSDYSTSEVLAQLATL